MSKFSKQSGFTAIELLITLFVAAAFLIAAYQLFNVVIRDGGEARAESRAGNVAYDYLQRYTPLATDPCLPQTPLTDSPIEVDGLTSAKITVTISCPDYSTTGLSKIEAKVSYDSPVKTVTFSTYANGSSNGTPDVTEGLLAWWKFNGDANTSVGSANGTVSNAVPTVGQNNQPNSALYFNGTNATVTAPFSFFPDTVNSATITLWTKSTGTQQSQVFGTDPGDSSNLLAFYPAYTDNLVYWEPGNSSTYVTTAYSSGWSDTWIFWAMSFDPSGVFLSRNGTVVASNGSLVKTFSKGTKNLLVGRNAGSVYWKGSVDDLRIYNRQLTAQEIQTLYAMGAR